MPVQLSKETAAYAKSKSLKQINYLVIDIQATGASPRSAHLFECAYQVFKFSEDRSNSFKEEKAPSIPLEAKVCLVQLPPGVRLSRVVSKLTGIKTKQLQKAIKASLLAQELWSVIEVIYQEIRDGIPWAFLAHVARYERSFIRALCLAHLPKSLSLSEAQIRFDTLPWLCTHAVSARLYPSLPRRSLSAMNAYFGGAEIKLKRAASHLEASHLIWRSLHEVLNTKGISTWGELVAFLAQSVKRGTFKPSLPAKIRLEAPSLPGVYKFYDQRSTVVYVGRARNLNQRVNQHFRGKKGHDERHLELLGVTHHVDWQVCASVLEAKHLENRTIKELNPRYNRALTIQDKPFYIDVTNFSLVDDCMQNDFMIVEQKTEKLSLHTSASFQTQGCYLGPWVDKKLIEHVMAFRSIILGDFSSIHQHYWPKQDLDHWRFARTLVIDQLKQANKERISIFREGNHQNYNSILNYLNWGYYLEKKNFDNSEEQECSVDSSVSNQDKKTTMSICESLMIKFWQTWRAAQWQNLLLQGEIIWLADTGKSQKLWRHWTLSHNESSQYVSQEPKAQTHLDILTYLSSCNFLCKPIDRLDYDQGRLTYLSLLSLSREGIASYYRHSSQDPWFKLDLLPKFLS